MTDISTNDHPRNNRAEINRSNAQNSTGPRTDAGKQRSCLNALRHGLTGQTVVLPSDDLDAYHRHCQALHEQYRPKNPMEVQLTQSLADYSWRLNRVAAIETNMLALGSWEHSLSVEADDEQMHDAFAMAKAFRIQSRSLANLSLHEHRLSLCFQKALKQLREIQAERIAQEKSDMYSAAQILQMHKKKRVPYDPVDDGFVFSNAEIETYIRRRDRESQAFEAA